MILVASGVQAGASSHLLENRQTLVSRIRLPSVSCEISNFPAGRAVTADKIRRLMS